MLKHLKNMRKNRSHADVHTLGKTRTFLTDETGTTAIEFAILGIPFLALLFGIIELALIFFISATTQHALETVARQIRTGEFQSASDTADAFKTGICTAMAGAGSCSKIRVDVVSSSTGKFSALSLPESPVACTGTPAEIEACESQPPAMPADSYASTASGDVVIVRVQYFHRLVLPSEITRLSNASGNTHIITHTTAFKNEPF
ncbi:MAG: hypothetical protein COA69_03755 [Robiginitomaculum sp.]|nr:MAG: hypothetical protein COA69_03755 [Robiginitomaculum sp.]